MGAWGTGNFDNDIACDWAYDLAESSDLLIIQKAVDAVFLDDDVDSNVCCEALAAIDTLSRLRGQIGVKNSYTEEVDKWVSANDIKPTQDLIDKSLQALQIIISDSSELAELWAGSGFDEWKAVVTSLESRLIS